MFLVLSKKGEHISSRHFVPTDQNKLCTHDKNRKRAELWVKNNLFNVFVMYALDSARVKFATSFPGSSLYLEKVPWLRLVTCLLDFSRFQRCD